MKLVKTKVDALTRRLQADGLFTVDLHYKASDATGEMDYTGPKMPPEMWQQILSFFKWTYDETKSESQVRLFVSPKLKQWKAWAFPQQAEMGLSTKELANDDAKKQRAELFDNDADWTAWGTVHHHCSIGAFQSGTDESDEKNVGGIHITVGDLDKARYSIHCRLYHQGDLYEPDMSKLWDIGNVMENLPEELKHLIPDNAADKIARSQMCIPSTVEFPNQWKQNFLRLERNKVETHQLYSWPESWPEAHRESSEAYPVGTVKTFAGQAYRKTEKGWDIVENQYEPVHRRGRPSLKPLSIRMTDAFDDLTMLWANYGYANDEEVYEHIEELVQNGADDLVHICKNHDLVADDLLDEYRRRMVEMTRETPNGMNSLD